MEKNGPSKSFRFGDFEHFFQNFRIFQGKQIIYFFVI